MSDMFIASFVVIGTVIAYLLALRIYKRINTPFLLPVTVATVIIIVVLLIFNISYETYMIGGKWIHLFLGPAVVSLAYPLYQQRDVLKRLALPLLIGIFLGAIIGVLTGGYMTKIMGFHKEVISSLIPKSVTTPVAMDISNSLGGISSLAAVFVMIAGISGAILCEYVFRLVRINESIGRGVGLGSASHAIGTAKALENSQLEGSISTIAMIVSAIFVSIIAPYIL